MGATQEDPTRSRRLVELRRKVEQYWSRYGNREGADDVEALTQGINRRRSQLRRVRAQLVELTEEAKILEGEIGGREKGLELLLDDIADRMRSRFAEGWSPFPVYGFRSWAVTHDGLVGAVERWERPFLTATCHRHNGDDEVPHSGGECGPPACGIYSTKDPAVLLTPQPKSDGLALGLVAMTGKVVEHRRGYRAQHAEVVALAVATKDRLLLVDDVEGIEAAFAAPLVAVRHGESLDGQPAARFLMDTYLIEAMQRRSPWTSESNNE
jgi:hypothetical protein